MYYRYTDLDGLIPPSKEEAHYIKLFTQFLHYGDNRYPFRCRLPLFCRNMPPSEPNNRDIR